MIENKPRKWWLAGLFSIFEPGMGQIYNGQGRKGLALLVFPLIYWPVVYYFCGIGEDLPWILGFAAMVAFFYYVGSFLDAVLSARKNESHFQPKKYNKIFYYLGIIVFIGIINIQISGFIKKNYIQAYSIPTGSNEPTLLVGDRILVDRRPSSRAPRRGNFIVFKFSKKPHQDFVKRVIGVGGDRVELREKVLLINGQEIKEPFAIYKDSKILPANLSPRDNFGPVTVPDSAYFVMGDNRDKSFDSRFWGFVESSQIKGIVKNLYWSWDAEEGTVRWERIGLNVR